MSLDQALFKTGDLDLAESKAKTPSIAQWGKSCLDTCGFHGSVLRSGLFAGGRPFRANVAVTKECHSRCQKCAVWKSKKSPEELRTEEYQKIAQNYPHLRWLSLTGGEPTDRRDLPEIVRCFFDSSPLHLVNFSTNGLNRDRVIGATEAIARLGIKHLIVSVSLDGPQPVHDRLRGIQGGFQRSINTLASLMTLEKAFSSQNCKVTTFASLTLFQENESEVEALLKELTARIPTFSEERLHINLGHSSPHLYANSKQEISTFNCSTAIEALLRRRKRRLNIQELLERIYQKLMMEYSNTARSPLSCAALKSSFFLNEKGVVYPCTIWDKPLGNLRDFDYSLGKLFAQEESRAARKDAAKGNCPNCWTPCEAFQSIAASPIQALLKSVI
jgi:Fe-coproporphyrin III synthase